MPALARSPMASSRPKCSTARSSLNALPAPTNTASCRASASTGSVARWALVTRAPRGARTSLMAWAYASGSLEAKGMKSTRQFSPNSWPILSSACSRRPRPGLNELDSSMASITTRSSGTGGTAGGRATGAWSEGRGGVPSTFKLPGNRSAMSAKSEGGGGPGTGAVRHPAPGVGPKRSEEGRPDREILCPTRAGCGDPIPGRAGRAVTARVVAFAQALLEVSCLRSCLAGRADPRRRGSGSATAGQVRPQFRPGDDISGSRG